MAKQLRQSQMLQCLSIVTLISVMNTNVDKLTTDGSNDETELKIFTLLQTLVQLLEEEGK